MPNSSLPARLMRQLILLLLVAAALLPGSMAHGQATPTITNIEIGFEGAYRVGKWTPVWVELAAGDSPAGAQLQITTPDGDGVPATYHELATASEAGTDQATRRLLYVKFGRTPTWLHVQLRQGSDVLADRMFSAGSFPAPQPIAREVILSLGGSVGVAEATQLSRRRGDDAYLPCSQADVSLLPEHWFGYDSIDTIVLVASNTEYLARWSEAQIGALTEWIAQGGRLIVSSGGELPDRWSEIYPGTYAETQVLRRSTALEVYTGATQRLDLVRQERFEMPATVLADFEGHTLLVDQLAGERHPLFLLAPRGFGVVLFSAIDLSAAPLNEWRDRPRLLLRLIRLGDESEPAAVDSGRSGGRVTHIGYKDLSGQLRSALEAFSFGGLSLIPFSWVAGLIVLYILLIGPVDYYFLRRVVGRMEYTWLTFPLIAVVLAGVAIGLTGFYKGDQLAMRQLTVLDHDLASGTQRHAMWAHVYSPANQRYALASSESTDSLLSWHGLPGTALGGMESPAAASGEQASYLLANSQQGGGVEVHPRAVPINAWSTKSFTTYAWATAAKADARELAKSSNLRETYDQRLLGQFANPTEHELIDCQLLYDRWAYKIRGQVGPGDRIFLADESEPRDLEWKMTRRQVSDDNKPVSSPWNPTELEVPRIAEMLMFHRAAGGVGYTELHNRQLQFLDLSRHLRLGRAVLVGRTKSPVSSLQINGESAPTAPDSQWTYVRVMIPVEPLQ